MDLQVLRWFQAVADGATVTETAQRAHITQPALSRALGRLEREVGTPLFTRAGRALRLTPAGRVFKHTLDQTLDRYDVGLRAVAELVDPDRGVVPLAFLHTLGTWLVPPLISGFRGAHPMVRFELRQHGEAGILQSLLDGVVDLILTSGNPGHPQVRWHRLLVEPLRLAVPSAHRLSHRKRIRLSEVAEEPFILLRSGYGLRTLTEELCRQAGFAPRVTFEGEEVETLRGLVAAGLGVALLPPPHAVLSTLDAVTAPITPAHHLEVTDVDATREIGLAWLADRSLPSSSHAFHQHVLAAGPTLVPAAYRTSRR
ncbi:LysR family transcriptional regulator [Rugosimonospora africana]|uniref:LysR family transcriptional regulator n=1 Tax=Rugosimonospora africana TaxID=556532 RepID=A0A8J3QVD2_9ACTN|nr:LysR family transcriptional regulator [Rugosimonospora africana]GIH15501.1 LysR family transcriptional regulator [Rugosimonospora africana]